MPEICHSNLKKSLLLAAILLCASSLPSITSAESGDENITVNHVVLVDTPPHPEWEWNYSYQIEVNDLQMEVDYTAVILIKRVDDDEWGGLDWWWDDIEGDGDQYNYTFSLQQGCYYINATLYDKNDLNVDEENAVVLAFDHLDFTVGNVECANQHWPERIFVWPDDVGGYDTAQNYSLTYNSGDNISVYTLYELDNLVGNITYLIEWYISNSSNTSLIASGNFTTNSTSNTGYSAPLPSASLNLSEGCYIVWAELHDDTGQLLDYDEFLLCIYDGNNTTNNDSDGDGITDSDDDCPNTPAGTAVDSHGCPESTAADSDGDGIPDSDDDCPHTPAGVPVNSTGCPEEMIYIWPDDVGGYDTAHNYSLNYSGSNHTSMTTLYEVDYLRYNITYLIEWYISNGSTNSLSLIASGNVTTNSTNNTGYSQALHATLYLSEDCYVVWAELYDDNGILRDFDEFLLCIYDESNTTSNDSDGDGIPDSDDDCPDTPAGTAVDSVGCPEPSTAYILVNYTMDERVVMFEGQNRTILADEGWALVSIEVGNLEPWTNYVLEWVVEDFSTVPPAELGCSNWPSTTPPGPCAGEMPLHVGASGITWGISFPVLEDSSNACFSIRLLSDDGSELASHNGTCWAQESQADWDSDGVRDVLDECGDTPIGTAVNSVGCPELTDSGDETNDTAETNETDTDTEAGLVPGFGMSLSLCAMIGAATVLQKRRKY